MIVLCNTYNIEILGFIMNTIGAMIGLLIAKNNISEKEITENTGVSGMEILRIMLDSDDCILKDINLVYNYVSNRA